MTLNCRSELLLLSLRFVWGCESSKNGNEDFLILKQLENETKHYGIQSNNRDFIKNRIHDILVNIFFKFKSIIKYVMGFTIILIF